MGTESHHLSNGKESPAVSPQKESRFVNLKSPDGIWAVPAIHANLDRLLVLHERLKRRIHPGQRLIYLGNYIGRGPSSAKLIDELLSFRQEILAKPGMLASDIVYLRGAQEEMWQKLLQIQFAPNPKEIMTWILGQGVKETLESYGGHAEEALAFVRDSVMGMTRWTKMLREKIAAHPGHEKFFTILRRAAFAESGQDRLLFVHAGLNPALPLEKQEDQFWWSVKGFDKITEPYASFSKIIRGFAQGDTGVCDKRYKLNLDDGCGYKDNGALVAAYLSPSGDILDLLKI